MRLNNFHCFSSLPPELRDAIWDFAACRPACRGVHYFTPFNPHEEEEDQTDSCALPILRISDPDAYGLYPPRSPKSALACSWISNNPSTYATAVGLWTACRDSRSALYRRHENETSAPLDEQIESAGREPGPAFGFEMANQKRLRLTRKPFGKKRQNSIKELSTIYPHYDLIYIQQRVWHDFATLVDDMPFNEVWSGKRITHFAFNYNPLWNAQIQKIEQETTGTPPYLYLDSYEYYVTWSDMYTLLTCAWEADSGIRLWLVDPRLRRKLTVFNESHSEDFWGLYEQPNSEAIAFEASDRRYYAVPRRLQHELCAYDGEVESSILDFLSSLYATATREANIEQTLGSNATVSEVIGILVCEDTG